MSKINVLSIDGGGIRGIIPAKILADFEEMIREISGDNSKTIADCFDLIAGTSTGGIIASGLLIPDNGKPKYSPKDLLELYLKRGEEIFNISFWQKIKPAGGTVDEKYDNETLKEALEDYFGKTKLSELLKPSLITAYDIRNRKGKFFNKMDAIENDKDDFYIKDVAYSTAAAPTYFECSRIKSMSKIPYVLIDGGVFANNPALCAYSEVRAKFKNKPTAKDINIVSVGTGTSEVPYYYKEAKDWGLIEWAKPLLSIMMSGVSETIDYQLRQIYDSIDKPAQYLRINGPLKYAEKDMDNSSIENLENLEKDGAAIYSKFRQEMRSMVVNIFNYQ